MAGRWSYSWTASSQYYCATMLLHLVTHSLFRSSVYTLTRACSASATPPNCPPTCATGGCATIPYSCQCTSNCTNQGCISGYTQVSRSNTNCGGGQYQYTCNRACGNNFNGQCTACLSGRWGVPGTCSGVCPGGTVQADNTATGPLFFSLAFLSMFDRFLTCTLRCRFLWRPGLVQRQYGLVHVQLGLCWVPMSI